MAACSFSFSAWVIPRNCHACKKQRSQHCKRKWNHSWAIAGLFTCDRPLGRATCLRCESLIKGRNITCLSSFKLSCDIVSRSAVTINKLSVFILSRHPWKPLSFWDFMILVMSKLEDKYIKIYNCEERR